MSFNDATMHLQGFVGGWLLYMFSVKSKQNKMYLNTETMLSLFDTYVRSVINYWCEIWGFHNGKDVEKVQLQYLKTLLDVKLQILQLFIVKLGDFK